MTVMKVSAVEPLSLKNVQDMVRQPGPCLSLFLPAYRPGEQAKSMAALLKTQLQEAARQLAQMKIPGSAVTDLLGPLEELAREDHSQAGSHWGRAIYRSPGVFRQFELIGPVSGALTVGGCFHLRPILAELYLAPEFYLLKLSKKGVELLRCARLKAEPVELPKGIQETLVAALALEPPDHDLENRYAVGSSTGSMRGVRFGTGSERETQRTYLSDYYKTVDRGIRELLNPGGAPLVLAGVDADTVIYRMANTYPNLLAGGVAGSFSGSMAGNENEMLEKAYWIVRSDSAEKSGASLNAARERLSPARFSLHLDAILNSALEGRVERVYIDESAQRLGVFEHAKRGGGFHGEEDLLNLAAVETISHGGQAFTLPNSKMPDDAVVAAVFRY